LQQAGTGALSELVWKIGASQKKDFCSFIAATSFCCTTVCLHSANPLSFVLRRGLNSNVKSIQKGGPLSTVFQLVGISLVLLPDAYHFNLKPLDTVQHTIKSVTK